MLLLEGTYGRVVGSLRAQRTDGQRYMVIYKVFPVIDMNELTCHNLEVIQVPLKLRKLKELEVRIENPKVLPRLSFTSNVVKTIQFCFVKARKTGVGVGGGMDNTFNNTMVGGGFGGAVGGGGGLGSIPTSDGGLGGFKPLENRVLNYIRVNQRENLQRFQLIWSYAADH